MPLMAVAAPAPVGEAERSEPAKVAEPDDLEEPVAMAEEQSADPTVQPTVTVDGAQPEQPAAGLRSMRPRWRSRSGGRGRG